MNAGDIYKYVISNGSSKHLSEAKLEGKEKNHTRNKITY